MQFTAEDITRYQDLCRRYFATEVTEQTAIEELSALVWIIRLIYHPLSHHQLDMMRRLVVEVPHADSPTTTDQDRSRV
jgi:hypothetical protein